ncbi:MAG: hypothetical protein N4A70_02045 [Pelagimonas sp.]|jgi:hypothetical protein|nr:hypothetical protein [Pelagimonas sp.]
MRAAVILAFGLTAAGCANGPLAVAPAQPPVAQSTGDEAIRPQARPGALSSAPKPPAGARTVEQFDTTSAQDRREAAKAPVQPAAEKALGETVASLGDPSKPGFWLETPLVSAATKGRVLNPTTGKSAQVDLLPIDGPASAGSRLSLAAMRLIEAPLTDLPTIQVFSGG